MNENMPSQHPATPQATEPVEVSPGQPETTVTHVVPTQPGSVERVEDDVDNPNQEHVTTHPEDDDSQTLAGGFVDEDPDTTNRERGVV